jgi:VCBS repeat-containing protein
MNFGITAGSLDYLAAGEELNLTYTVEIDDGDGGIDTEDFTITVTGTNDDPTITSVIGITDVIGLVNEDATALTLTDTGTITFEDVDLTDDHVISVVKASGNLGGTLTTDTLTNVNDWNLGVPWTYSVDNSATQYLGLNETASEVFTVTISDGKGGTIYLKRSLMLI